MLTPFNQNKIFISISTQTEQSKVKQQHDLKIQTATKKCTKDNKRQWNAY